MPPEPICTYRLQLTPDFGFDAAAAVVPYLARLGVSHVYLSPVTQAAPGSGHGYDVCDPAHLNEDLGGAEAYERLCAALAAAGMGQVLDIVPNHMAVALPENRWLDSVLRYGPDDAYAACFDLHWSEAEDGTPYVELPVLTDDYEAVLAAGDIRVVESPDGRRLQYGALALPLRPGSEPSATELAPQALDALLRRQHYRLVHWRQADERLFYRRFFDITSLIGLRVEDEGVFDASHALALRLVAEGKVDGLRVDHVDGLRDPGGYLRRLRARAPGARVLVEKILAPDEALPEAWPVDGTTGYDFLIVLNGLFVDPAGEAALTAFYAEFAGTSDTYAEVLADCKRGVLQHLFRPEVSQLAELLRQVAGEGWSLDECRSVLRAVLIEFPVYRTYARPAEPPSGADAAIIDGAVGRARAALVPHLEPLLRALRDALLLRLDGAAAAELALRFQQLSGPVMAKGAEDTAFYNYNRLVSLNEVGGDPSRFGVSVARFHAFCAETARRRPLTMTATATHDTKRGEDARLRVDALSQVPGEWAEAVRRWAAINQPLRQDGRPDRNFEYLLYQNLLAAWPLSPERATAFALKAAREAKAHTSWRQPDEAYEAAIHRFVAGAVANDAFVASLASFVDRIDALALPATLAQTLLKLTAPGVPDVYQGCELLDLSLVDPDNRRPVDYALRRDLLQKALRYETAGHVLKEGDPAFTKLWLTQRTLQTRREHAPAFRGAYTPLPVDGNDALVAFDRGGEAVVLAPTRGAAAGSVTLPPGRWRDVLANRPWGGGLTPVADLLGDLNLALLVREASA